MKPNILFAIALFSASPFCLYAQEETGDDNMTGTRALAPVQKTYETRTVSGVVVDATTNKPLAGALVSASGVDGYSTLTGEDGSYELKVPLFTSSVYVTTPEYNSVLVGLGRKQQQRPAALYPSSFSADYTRQTNVRNDRTASDFQYTGAINIKEEVQNQLGAFAYTTSRNGTPGVGNTMFVQGLNSINVNAQPLVVVDGVILDQQYSRSLLHDGFYNDVLTNINPADIEDVTVMRNGTALYGAKGANGVIIITTRRCKSMATRITANVSAGVTFLPGYIDMMDASQYRGYASEMLKSTNTKMTEFKFLNENPDYYYYPQYHNNTDWKDMLYHEALTQNYGINVEGGDTEAQYNLSVGYTSAESALEYNNMHRLNIRFNTDINLSSKFDVRFDMSYSNITRNIRDDGAPSGYDEGTPTSPAFLGYVKSPFLSPYTYGRGQMSDTHLDIDDETYLDEALAYYTNYNYKLGNPVAINEYADAENKNRFENSLLNLAVRPTYRFNQHLSLSEHFSYTLVNTNENYYIPLNGVPDYYVTAVSGFRENEVRSLFSKQNSVQSDTRIDWHNRYGAHSVHLFGGARINWESYSLNTQLGYNTGSDKTPYLSSSLANAQTAGLDESWNSLAWYAQAEYNYKERYFIQANLTAEGSSRFGTDAGSLHVFDAAWAVFPSVQLAWVMSNESWMQPVKGIDYLRLTAGYDVSGNDDIDFYAARSYFRVKQYLNAIAGLSFDGIGNTKIQWETTRRFNVGLESSLLNNRLAVSFNYFHSWTDNLLTRQQLSFISGLDENWNNGGKLENQGFDVSFNAKVVALKDWQWQVGASVGHYKNKVTELPDGKQYIDTDIYDGTVRTQVGQPVNLFYGYKTLGVYATSEDAMKDGKYIVEANGIDRKYFEAGDINFYDVNNDGKICDADDRVIIGDPNPDIYGNIFTSVQWKRLRLDVRFNYSLGNDVYNYMRSQLEGGSRFMNQTTAMTRRWQVEGQQTDVPRITFQDPMGNSRFSDRWIEDGSYLRLKTVTLSYDLPVKSQFLQGMQFWIQANNLFTVSKYLGADPEFASSANVIGMGVDTGCLPQSRNIMAGIKINL